MSPPLDEARALFGDALADRKQLRRAYARLIRQHPPDADAERFQAIRDAYEAALAALDRPAGEAAPTDAPGLEEIAAGLTPQTFDATLAALVVRGHHDADAMMTALFLVQATRPATAIEWLVEQRQRGLPDRPLVLATTTLLDARPEAGCSPLIGALGRTLDAADAATLDGHCIRAGIRAEQFDGAFERWRSREGSMRGLCPEVWQYVADAILFFAGERTPDDVLARIEEAMEDVQLDMSEYRHAELVDGLENARALKATHADPLLPDSFTEALRMGQRTSAVGNFSAMRQCKHTLTEYGDGSLSLGLARLGMVHPVAFKMLRSIEQSLTRRLDAHHTWLEEGPPEVGLPDDLVALVEAAIEPRAFWLTTERMHRGVLIGALVLSFVLRRLVGLNIFVGFGIAIAVALVAGFFLGKWIDKREPQPLRPTMARLDALQSTYGLWRHEILVAAAQAPVPISQNLWYCLGIDEVADLRCLSPVHGYRAATADRPGEADEDDGDDSAEEPDDPA